MKISSTAITVAVMVVVSNPGWANTAPSSFSTSMVGTLMTITRQALKSRLRNQPLPLQRRA